MSYSHENSPSTHHFPSSVALLLSPSVLSPSPASSASSPAVCIIIHVRLSYEHNYRPVPPINEHLASSATTARRAHARLVIGHHIQLRAPSPFLLRLFLFSLVFLPAFLFFSFYLARRAYVNLHIVPCCAISLPRRYNNPYTYVHFCLPSVCPPHSLYTAPLCVAKGLRVPKPQRENKLK
ncbi:hypothetical protein HYPSUDRAFT_668974 [Hypholoma sublateritium FD-334 SS-4]|uniref:Uncharacterized protein n=1 Tax=Hypholoma sublateritium (strain FD-334 SS-4) TaxID=945553 RepID=A0A0D2MF17_HYPSF|nr:hypothetical protein HYPSUDRAFT_668974 [Hypholoma sublateritium FD-334 SS-4]